MYSFEFSMKDSLKLEIEQPYGQCAPLLNMYSRDFTSYC